jgi:uncharacterized protein YgiM (DUF1202 family)
MRRWITVLAAALAALTGAAQEYGVVDISVCNLRATPDYDAEMVSQALLGTPVHILQITSKNNWPQVQTPDTYTGWVHKDAITLLSFEEYHAWNAAPKIVVTALTGAMVVMVWTARTVWMAQTERRDAMDETERTAKTAHRVVMVTTANPPMKSR